MNFLLPLFCIALGGYLIGSFPTGYLAGCCCGIDVRLHGSGNVGATNVLRLLGKKWGYSVFLIDFLKGWLPVFLALLWSDTVHMTPPSAPGAIAALASLLGHSFYALCFHRLDRCLDHASLERPSFLFLKSWLSPLASRTHSRLAFHSCLLNDVYARTLASP